MATVTEAEVLLCWRALRHFRAGRRPTCAPRGKPATSVCPLFDDCPRWRGQPDDYFAAFDEDEAQTDGRRAAWPCTRLLNMLDPQVRRIGA